MDLDKIVSAKLEIKNEAKNGKKSVSVEYESEAPECVKPKKPVSEQQASSDLRKAKVEQHECTSM